MEKTEWGKLVIIVVVWVVTAYYCYWWGVRDCEATHEVKLSKSTENIQNYEEKKDTILTEPDADAYRRAMEHYKRSGN